MAKGPVWSVEENARLFALKAAGGSCRAIAKDLGRSEKAISSRLNNIRSHSLPTTRGKSKQRNCLCCKRPFSTQQNYYLCRYCRTQSLSPYAI